MNEQIKSLRLKPCLCHRPTHHTLITIPSKIKRRNWHFVKWSLYPFITKGALSFSQLLSSYYVPVSSLSITTPTVITVMHTFFQSWTKKLITFARWFNVLSMRRKGRLHNIEGIRPTSTNLLQHFQRGAIFHRGSTGEKTFNPFSAETDYFDVYSVKFWRLKTVSALKELNIDNGRTPITYVFKWSGKS